MHCNGLGRIENSQYVNGSKIPLALMEWSRSRRPLDLNIICMIERCFLCNIKTEELKY